MLGVVYVNNSFHSVPTLVRADASLSRVVYPGAWLTRLDFVLAPDSLSVSVDWTTGTRWADRVVWSVGHFLTSVIAWDSTGRSSQPVTAWVDVSRPNPVAVLNPPSLTHGGYTVTVVTLVPDQSRVNFPGTKIAAYQWASNIEAIDGSITYPPFGGVSVRLTESRLNNYATVTVFDSRGLTDKARVTFNVMDGTPRANFRAEYRQWASDCRIARYNYYGSNSFDPSGAKLAQYAWSVDGQQQRSSASSSWDDWYYRYYIWSRTVRIALVVTTDQAVRSDPFETQVNVAPNDCKSHDDGGAATDPFLLLAQQQLRSQQAQSSSRPPGTNDTLDTASWRIEPLAAAAVAMSVDDTDCRVARHTFRLDPEAVVPAEPGSHREHRWFINGAWAATTPAGAWTSHHVRPRTVAEPPHHLVLTLAVEDRHGTVRRRLYVFETQLTVPARLCV